jgi:hypothetical protein
MAAVDPHGREFELPARRDVVHLLSPATKTRRTEADIRKLSRAVGQLCAPDAPTASPGPGV